MIYTYIFVAAWAAWCAWDDQQQIQRGQRILHALQWAARTSLVVAVLALFTVNSHLYSLPQIMFLAIGSGALFSMVFRYCLNRMRGLDWRYISPSSWYDYVYLVISGAWSWKPNGWKWKNWQGLMRNSHTGSILFDSQYQSSVHRAGLIAYACELVVLVACSYLSSVL